MNNVPALRPSLLVCERTLRWHDALRRACVQYGIPRPELRAVRSPEQLRAAVIERRRLGREPALPVIELTAAETPRVCEFLQWHVACGDDVPATVAASTDAVEYEAATRMAGASLFIASPNEIEALVRLAQRFVVDAPQRSLPRDVDERPLVEQLRDRLPWGSK